MSREPPSARPKRALSGVLLLDKPRGITSQAAVTRVKRLFQAAKAGHTGTLDPMAEGLLPICLGEATKFSQLMLDADKGYRATARLGVTTTTGDLEGEVTATAPVAVDRAALSAAIERFAGEILQTPPMYSALKHEGQRLYDIARSGRTVARDARRVRIHGIVLREFSGDEFTIDVLCSKGTYIRVLAEDIGAALGCGASLAALIRTRVGDFRLEEASTLGALEAMDGQARDARILPVDSLVAGLPRLELDAEGARRLSSGQTVERRPAGALPAGLARIFGPGGRFLGVAEVEPAGKVVPRRLMAGPARREAPGIT